MDVAELRAIYTATSADFDRVTDHVQRRLKETQATARGVGGAAQSITAEAKKIETSLTSRAPVRFLGIDVASEKKAAAEVVNTARTTADQVQQTTAKFDRTAFWARQGTAASNAAKVTETETKRAASSVTSAWASATTAEERLHARRAAAATKATSTVIRDARTGATLTQAELAKIISGGSKVVEAEAKKVGQATGNVFNDLRRLFLQNNFLFRQLGQRVAGDLGFAAVGAGKLALNFEQLATSSGGAAAEMGTITASATSALGVLGPLGLAVGVVTVGVAALAAATVAAGAGMFYFAKSVADTEEHFDDLSRQTGLAADNLQVLDIVSRQSGSNIDKLVGSVGQLQRKLIDASEGGTSRFSLGLKKLGIDLEDPNKALSQLVDLLSKLPAGTVRTGAAMQIFGRGGREVAGVVDQIVENVGNADGALDRLKKQFQDAGIHIDQDGVRTAAKFHDELIKVEAQIESVKRVIGEEALPTVLRAATKFSDWIAENRVTIGFWAREIEHVAEAVLTLSGQLLKLAAIAALPMVLELRLIPKIVGDISGAGLAGDAAKALGNRLGTPIERSEDAGEFAVAGGAGQFSQGAGARSGTADADAVAKRIRDAFAPKGRGGGKGEDPAQTARRLAEIALQETLKGLHAEHDALQRQLDQNLIARDKYTQDAVNLELKRRQAALDGLQKELAEAEKIRKPGQRAVKVAEINARIRDEERRSAKEVTQITDDAAAEQLRVGQATANSRLRVIETETEKIKARARDYADFREITEREAAAVEEQQTLRVFGVRQRILEDEKRAALEGSEKWIEAQGKLNELDAERAAFIEAQGRRTEAAVRRDAEHVIQFAAQIRDAFQRAQDVRLDAGEMNLEPLRNSILTRHQLWDAELQFEITREEQRHDRTVQGFKDDEAMARIRIKNAVELAQTLAGIRARERAEEESHQARLRQLTTQAAEQRRQELLRVADDLASIASDIFDAIGKSSEEFWNSLRQTVSSFAKQIRDELFKGLLETAITGQAQGAEGLIGAIINPLLGAVGPHAEIADNSKATRDNTAAVNALTQSMGGVAPIPTTGTGGGLSGLFQFLPGIFGGHRAQGGPAEAGRVYRVHENEVFFRPNLSGQIVNMDRLQGLAGSNQRDEVRLNVAFGQDAVDDMIQSHSVTPKGRRAALVRAKYNRKVGKLLFT
jgi:hypothetical protein